MSIASAPPMMKKKSDGHHVLHADDLMIDAPAQVICDARGGAAAEPARPPSGAVILAIHATSLV
jgi:hypothetical protein